MAKKPIPMPVSNEPDYPSLAEMNSRAVEEMAARQRNEHQMYAACPSCGQQLTAAEHALKSTSYEPTRPVFCRACGWSGSAYRDCY
jgi:hypothetical protein